MFKCRYHLGGGCFCAVILCLQGQQWGTRAEGEVWVFGKSEGSQTAERRMYGVHAEQAGLSQCRFQGGALPLWPLAVREQRTLAF